MWELKWQLLTGLDAQESSMIQSHSTFIAAQPAQPSIPPALIHLTGTGLILLMVAGLSKWLNRSPVKVVPAPPQSERLNLQQPLQWIGYAKQFERAGDYESALRLYDQALQHYPSDYRLWHERGLILAKLQRFEAALASYDRAYAIYPQQRDLAHERGDTLLQLGRYSEAIDSFDIFLQYLPNNGHVLADRGYALMQLGCYHEALQSIEQVLSRRWEPAGVQIQARRYQIEALSRSGQLESAFAAAQTAVQQYPDATEFSAQYTALRQQLGRG
jgi:tetratricopeptide (TPR) repeat protein